MSAKWNYILGTVTIGLIVGGTVYAIVKAKQAAKAEEDSISLEEARDIVNASDLPERDEVRYETEIEEVIFEKPSILVTEDEYMDDDEGIEELLEEDDNPLHDRYELLTDDIEGPTIPSIEPLKDFMYIEEGINPKEDKELRYDKDSDEAKHQYIRMELADWDPMHTVYRVMLQLFEIPFVPSNHGDEILRTQIIDHKVQFFGYGSKWNREVSFADVIAHYSRNAEFNCGEFFGYWVEYFLQFTPFEWDTTSAEFDKVVDELNNHKYFNEERQTFGLFGLTHESMAQAISIANGNVERSVTYEIEFQEFLKASL